MTVEFSPPSDAAVAKIKTIVGDSGWVWGSEATRYCKDPRGHYTGKASLIVRPACTADVARIIKICNRENIAVIPYSGGTGLVAGQLSIDHQHTIVLSLERMNRIREVCKEDGVLIAEAGCVLETVHIAAKQHNLMFPLSMASKGSCCIGGNLATNAGGIQVVRHGNARDLCLGIEAVLPCGSVYSELNPLRKNNTGYDIRNLLIGSEGTLGVITAATLVLKPIDAEKSVTLCAVESPARAVALYKRLQLALDQNICALELMSGFGIQRVTEYFPQLQNPFSEQYNWSLLVEITGPAGICERFEDVLAACFEEGLLLDAAVAQSETQQQAIWGLREFTPESNQLGGVFCSSDTSVPISKVDAFISTASRAIFAIAPDVLLNIYGHIGDGNIHINVLPSEGMTKHAFLAKNSGVVDAIRNVINETTAEFGGSISAEHGIGRLKTKDLEVYTDATKLALIQSIKHAIDPNGIMNPGAVIPINETA